jgi:hypothetical protein
MIVSKTTPRWTFPFTGQGKTNTIYIIMDEKDIYCFSVHFGVV